MKNAAPSREPLNLQELEKLEAEGIALRREIESRMVPMLTLTPSGLLETRRKLAENERRA